MTRERAAGVSIPRAKLTQPRAPVLATREGEPAGPPGLSPATVNRALAAVSSFYDWAILAGRFEGANPIARVMDRALVRAADRHPPSWPASPASPRPGARCRSRRSGACRGRSTRARSRPYWVRCAAGATWH